MFRPDLAQLREKVDASKGGRPPIDPLLKFKMLILQSLYSLSDDALEQQVLDRSSFMRFLGLGMGDDIPDAKTIWAFRERLKEHGLAETLFARIGEYLNRSGFDAKRGQIVDASAIRVRVKHVFGAQLQRAGTLIVRTIGLVRAKMKIGIRNLAYNLTRFVALKRGIVS